VALVSWCELYASPEGVVVAKRRPIDDFAPRRASLADHQINHTAGNLLLKCLHPAWLVAATQYGNSACCPQSVLEPSLAERAAGIRGSHDGALSLSPCQSCCRYQCDSTGQETCHPLASSRAAPFSEDAREAAAKAQFYSSALRTRGRPRGAVCPTNGVRRLPAAAHGPTRHLCGFARTYLRWVKDRYSVIRRLMIYCCAHTHSRTHTPAWDISPSRSQHPNVCDR
jgi:hypothetical protein